MKCRHCGVKNANRPRGLCWAHYHDLDIRSLYPAEKGGAVGSGGGHVSTGREDFNGPSLVPGTTKALPGSERKIEVMRRRAMLRQAVHNPRDARANVA